MHTCHSAFNLQCLRIRVVCSSMASSRPAWPVTPPAIRSPVEALYRVLAASLAGVPRLLSRRIPRTKVASQVGRQPYRWSQQSHATQLGPDPRYPRLALAADLPLLIRTATHHHHALFLQHAALLHLVFHCRSFRPFRLQLPLSVCY